MADEIVRVDTGPAVAAIERMIAAEQSLENKNTALITNLQGMVNELKTTTTAAQTLFDIVNRLAASGVRDLVAQLGPMIQKFEAAAAQIQKQASQLAASEAAAKKTAAATDTAAASAQKLEGVGKKLGVEKGLKDAEKQAKATQKAIEDAAKAAEKAEKAPAKTNKQRVQAATPPAPAAPARPATDIFGNPRSSVFGSPTLSSAVDRAINKEKEAVLPQRKRVTNAAKEAAKAAEREAVRSAAFGTALDGHQKTVIDQIKKRIGNRINNPTDLKPIVPTFVTPKKPEDTNTYYKAPTKSYQDLLAESRKRKEGQEYYNSVFGKGGQADAKAAGVKDPTNQRSLNEREKQDLILRQITAALEREAAAALKRADDARIPGAGRANRQADLNSVFGTDSKTPFQQKIDKQHTQALKDNQTFDKNHQRQLQAQYDQENRDLAAQRRERRRLAAEQLRRDKQQYERSARNHDTGSALDKLRGGLKYGRGEHSTPFQIGQVLRTSLLYSSAFTAIRGVTTALKASLQEAVAFQSGITDLAVATNQSRDSVKEIAHRLGETANQYGFSGSVGLEAGIRVAGVFGAINANKSQREAIQSTGGEAVLRQAFLSGKDVSDITSSIAAISSAFKIGAASIESVSDTLTYVEREFGIKSGSLLDSLPSISALAEAGGFTLAQSAGLAASVQQRTGQTATASAGLLSQILTREGEGSMQQIYDELEIVGQTTADRFQKLSKMFPDLTDSQQNRVASSFGKGRSQSAAIGLLDSLGFTFDTAEAAKTGAPGLARKQEEMRLNDIGGQIRQFQGSLKALQTAVGDSGLLSAFGLLLVGTRELAEITSDFLELWGQMPGVIKLVISSMLALALANKFGAGAAFGNLLTRRVTAGANPLVNNPILGGGAKGGVKNAGTAVLNNPKGAFLALGGPLIALAALAGAAALVKGSFDQVNEASKKVRDTLSATAEINIESIPDIESSISTLRNAATERNKVRPFLAEDVFGHLGGRADENREAEVRGLRATADFRERYVNGLKAEEEALKKNAGDPGALVFGNLSSEEISKGFDTLSNQGIGALTALERYSRAIDKNARSAEQAAAIFNNADFAGDFAIQIRSQLQNVKVSDEFKSGTREVGTQETLQHFAGYAFQDKTKSITEQEAADRLLKSLPDEGKISEILLAELNKQGATPEKLTDPEFVKGLKGGLFDSIFTEDRLKQAFGEGTETPEGMNQINRYRKSFGDYIDSKIGSVQEILSQLGQAEFFQRLTNVSAQIDRAITEVDPGDTQSLIRVYDYGLQLVEDEIANAKDTVDLTAALKKKRELLVTRSEKAIQVATNRFEAMANAGTFQGNIFAQAGAVLSANIDDAAQSGNWEGLIELMTNANNGTIKLARESYRRFLLAKVKEAEGKGDLDALIAAATALTEFDTGEGAFNESADAASAASDTPDQKKAAKARAFAVKTKSKVDDAEADLQQAQADFDKLKRKDKKDQAYWDAYGRVNAAENAVAEAKKEESQALRNVVGTLVGSALANAFSAMKDAEAAAEAARVEADFAIKQAEAFAAKRNYAVEKTKARSTARSLKIDLTDPVQVAFEEVKQIEEELAATLDFFKSADSDGGKKITAQENNALNEIKKRRLDAKNSAKGAEFDAFLSGEQRDLDLGRQTRGDFIRDLKSKDALIAAEMAGMSKTSNGYKMLQEQRDQLAQTIKAAAEGMDAQFNLGDIDIPTVYQGRQYAKSLASPGGIGAMSAAMAAQNNFQISGYNIDELMNKLQQILGDGGNQTVQGY